MNIGFQGLHLNVMESPCTLSRHNLKELDFSIRFSVVRRLPPPPDGAENSRREYPGALN